MLERMSSRPESLLITEASALGVSKLASMAATGHTTILQRRNQPVAAVIGYAELERLNELERDMLDFALVVARAATDAGARTSLGEVIGSFGYTREQLKNLPEPAPEA